ncbi:RELT-like protein 2 isoform X2 [Hyla sarda]|nr:RELT-like protein 2 isoform X2 [Hyla sarda]XP_056373058.1 RELT-like protein 2 isoform X2 [Hyla sarda]XP_056373059.1 RELT-like protein 2 isoform X2 [Hyla sarda]XP_056373060.1 RELT-like protein 2 isoform X2 [Hyla sarda]XP_056373061.1 RELT-like protein 2 isoform X2 [Hyla sarda]XP_056373062.1 RELT-like protein 2 isoform X2 [Hyla sarda]XP_056373063.1 RELT-like protein 2 isoform X2 [Hyla sarda]
MEETNNTEDGEDTSQQSPNMLFLLILVFFIMGLVGFFICHILKKKGYRCRTSPEEDYVIKSDSNSDQEIPEEMSNEDTVERIVKCIIENEANAEALKQMLGETEGDVQIGPSLCPHRESQDAGPPHHHTVHLGSMQAPCIHCSRKKRSLLHRMGRSKDSRGKAHPGEVTVFSVGRFRVTHIGKKTSIQGSQDDPNISSDPISFDKDTDDQTEKKTKNGLGIHQHFETQEVSQNGPELVGLAKTEVKDTVNSISGHKLIQEKVVERGVYKGKGSKDRRSSAPEQTAVQRERIDMSQLRGRDQQKGRSSEQSEKQANKEDSSREQ